MKLFDWNLLIELQDFALKDWYEERVDLPSAPSGLKDTIVFNHYSNYSLWQLEDQVRRKDLPDSEIVQHKRRIDGWNQKRNDAVEKIDKIVIDHFSSVDFSEASLHSETVGMMTDRLSILGLKIRSYRLLAERGGELSTECGSRHEILCLQRDDLFGCLLSLLGEMNKGTRYFKLYHQFKAYNDNRFNPALNDVEG